MTTKVLPPKNETIKLSVTGKSPHSRQILPREIKGVETHMVTVPAGARFDTSSAISKQAIYFVVEGAGTFATGDVSPAVPRLTLFAAKPGAPAKFVAAEDTCLLQIRMDLRPEESAKLKESIYPMVKPYAECEHYRDYFKSEKTVSRTLVAPFTLPRFCMGSVQTTGPDRIEPHAHPMLDQLFFSFAENDCALLVDGASFHFGGNCLLHIPLGSDHGVDAKPGDTVHYLWLDFFEKAEEMQYLVDVHKPVKA
jgi:mannose-6-phosphate isomerase-like protein (cupin superfamily)